MKSIDEVIQDYMISVYERTEHNLAETARICKRHTRTVRFYLARAGRLKTNDRIFKRKKWQQGKT